MRGLKFKKALPIILSVLGVIGVGATVVVTINDTNRCNKNTRPHLKDDFKKAATPKAKMEVVAEGAKAYAPTIAVSVLTSACIIGSIVLSKKTEASLIAAYGIVAKSYERYKETNIKMNGQEADLAIQKQMATDMFDERNYRKGSDQLFYDEYTEEYFEGDLKTVINASYRVNEILIKRSYVTLNQLYRFMGKKEIYFGNDVGWSLKAGKKYGYEWIDIVYNKVDIDDDLECLIVSISNPPTPDFLNA